MENTVRERIIRGGRSGKSKEKSSKEFVYVLYRYDPYNGDDTDIVDVYRSADGAKAALIELIKEDFMIAGGEVGSEYETTESYSSEESSNGKSTGSKDVRKASKKEVPVPGFDKKNWDHMYPIILEGIDACKTGWWEYENKYGYQNFKCVKTALK